MIKKNSKALARLLSGPQVDQDAESGPLTGLTTRLLFLKQLEDTLRSPNADAALLLVDLGMQSKYLRTPRGDLSEELLNKLAMRLVAALPKSSIVGRYSGSTFAVILPGRMLQTELRLFSRKIVKFMRRPVRFGGLCHRLDCYVGVAFASECGPPADALLERANLALNEAFDSSDRVCTFDADLQKALGQRQLFIQQLDVALAKNQLAHYYQPIFDARTYNLTGFEALLRWQHPTRGLVMPGEFLPIAERAGRMQLLGHWGLEKACNDLHRFPAGLKVNLNVSPTEFLMQDYPRLVRKAIAKTGADPRLLVLELTETVIMQCTATSLEAVRRIREFGIQIALDDFGTGYSSLSLLQKLPIDTLKIDRSFSGAVSSSLRNQLLTYAIINLASQLGIETVAEGVETEQDAQLLAEAGCTRLQGYYLGKPMPLADALQFADAMCFRQIAETKRKPDSNSIFNYSACHTKGRLRGVGDFPSMPLGAVPRTARRPA